MKTIATLVAALSLVGCANLTFEERQAMGANLINAGAAISASQPVYRPPVTTTCIGGRGYATCTTY